MTSIGMKALAGSDHITPETQRIIVPAIQRNPGHLRQLRMCTSFVQPLANQRRLAKTSRCTKQDELTLQPGIQFGPQMLTRHKRGLQTRRAKLWFEQHIRMRLGSWL